MLDETRHYSAPNGRAEVGSKADRAATHPGFVLTTASALGTLAAARCLGDRGVPLFVLDAQRFAPAAWSRYVVHRETFPKVRPVETFIRALVAFGARNPGHVLYPTSDDLAWAFAKHVDTLRSWFRVVTPSFSCVSRALDKRELYEACREADVRVPETWFPSNAEEVERAAAAARFPVIVKPRSQVFFTSARKGVVVPSPRALGCAYSAFARENGYELSIARERPDMERPMIQQLHAGAPIYSISGFCEQSRKLFVARGARKVLQWPRRAGVGIAFEDAPVNARLAEGVRRLCRILGFFGAFEAEFVETDDGFRLIDFNPRFFNQIGFDVARGLPSPYLVHLLALGDVARLEAAVRAAQEWRPLRGGAVFTHRSMIAWTRAAERIAGRRPAPILHGSAPPGTFLVVDAAIQRSDWVPGLFDSVRQVGSALTHPRSTLRAAARGYG